MSEVLAEQVLELLDQEREALRHGAFDVLDDLAETKIQLFNGLAQRKTTRSQLARIQKRLDENQSLLSAAIRGVSAARERLEALQNVREGLTIYDQAGQVAQVPTNRPAVEKKA